MLNHCWFTGMIQQSHSLRTETPWVSKGPVTGYQVRQYQDSQSATVTCVTLYSSFSCVRMSTSLSALKNHSNTNYDGISKSPGSVEPQGSNNYSSPCQFVVSSDVAAGDCGSLCSPSHGPCAQCAVTASESAEFGLSVEMQPSAKWNSWNA